MIPNNSSNPLVRLSELVNTHQARLCLDLLPGAKDYIKVTAYRLEEEKMAVIIQKMVGAQHDNGSIPILPASRSRTTSIPLRRRSRRTASFPLRSGLERRSSTAASRVRFCPKYPNRSASVLLDGGDARQQPARVLRARPERSRCTNSRRPTISLIKNFRPRASPRSDGTLRYVGSTYSPENDAVIGRTLPRRHPRRHLRAHPPRQDLSACRRSSSCSWTWAPGEWEPRSKSNLPSTCRRRPANRRNSALLQMRPLVSQQRTRRS